MLQLSCPRCEKIVDAPEKLSGKRVACPFCKQVMRVPVLEPETAAAPALVPLDDLGLIPLPSETPAKQSPPAKPARPPAGLTPLGPAKQPSSQTKPAPTKPATPSKPVESKPAKDAKAAQEVRLPKPPAPTPPAAAADDYGLAPLDSEPLAPLTPAPTLAKPPGASKAGISAPTTTSLSPAAAPVWSMPGAAAPSSSPAPLKATAGLTPLPPVDDLFDDLSTSKPLPAGVGLRPPGGSPYVPGGGAGYALAPPEANPTANAYVGHTPAFAAPAPAAAQSDGVAPLICGIFGLLFGLASVVSLCLPVITIPIPLIGLILGGLGLYLGRSNWVHQILPGVATLFSALFMILQIFWLILFISAFAQGIEKARENQRLREAQSGGGFSSGMSEQLPMTGPAAEALLAQLSVDSIEVHESPGQITYKLRLHNRSSYPIGAIVLDASWLKDGQVQRASVSSERFVFARPVQPGMLGEGSASNVRLSTDQGHFRVDRIRTAQLPDGTYLVWIP